MTTDELLERIANALERIADALEEKNLVPENGNHYDYIQSNKTLEIKETRQLMQDIVKYYKDTEPPINVEIGTKLHIYRFRDTIAKIKNIKNTKFEHRRLIKWIRKLEEYQFVTKATADQFLVQDTGKDWGQI